MALPAGRVGVKRTSVDWQGNVKGNGGSSDTYTKQQIDNKFGGLTFRDNEGTPQVKTAEGEWVNFNSGGDVPLGWNVPTDLLITDGLTPHAGVSIVSGGYYTTDNYVYVDITVEAGGNISNNVDVVSGLPRKIGITNVLIGISDANNDATYSFKNNNGYLINNSGSAIGASKIRIFGMC